MRAVLRDQKRKSARARIEHLLDVPPGSLVTKEERAKLWEQCQAWPSKLRRVSGRRKDEIALQLFEANINQLEAQRVEERKLVKPADRGLIVSDGRLIITPQEARQMAAGR